MELDLSFNPYIFFITHTFPAGRPGVRHEVPSFGNMLDHSLHVITAFKGRRMHGNLSQDMVADRVHYSNHSSHRRVSLKLVDELGNVSRFHVNLLQLCLEEILVYAFHVIEIIPSSIYQNFVVVVRKTTVYEKVAKFIWFRIEESSDFSIVSGSGLQLVNLFDLNSEICPPLGLRSLHH